MAKRKSIDEITDNAKNELRKEKSGATWVAMLELSNYISWSGISREVFGKSPNWLLQRLHGYEVNGRPARFKEEEYEQLTQAMTHIAELLQKNADAIRQAEPDKEE